MGVAGQALITAILASSAGAAAQEGSARDRMAYELTMDEDTSPWNLEVVDGIVVPDELGGGERVKVMLVGAPLDREAFLAEFADAGNVLFAAKS